MIKKDIKFKDLDGNDVVETWYFSLSKIELAEKDILSDGGYSKKLQEVIKSNKASEVYPILKEFILDSVGLRSDDGKRLLKTDDIRGLFVGSSAYETLIFEMLGDSNLASEFMNAIMPADLLKQAQQLSGTLEKSEEPAKPKGVEEYSLIELTNMPYPEFEALMNNTDFRRLPKDVLVLAMQRKTMK